MAFAVDHSQNFPREFYICKYCGREGVYVVMRNEIFMIRCKYCGRLKGIEREYWLGLENELEFF